MSLHRQNNRMQTARSIDDRAQQGKHTQQTVVPLNGLTPQKRHITTVRRGDQIDLAPVSISEPDPIAPGRLPVFARSGNDDDQHNRVGEDHEWGLVGDLTPKEIDAQTADGQRAAATAIGIGAVLAIGALMLLKR
jgi:hypothetical protein